MDTNLMKRAAGAVSIVAISAAVAVACSQQDKDAAKESVSSATSAASSAISAVAAPLERGLIGQ